MTASAATLASAESLGSVGGEAKVQRSEDVYEVKPSGNAVNVEQQMMLVAETAMDHQLALNLYQKHLGMIRTALGRGSR